MILPVSTVIIKSEDTNAAPDIGELPLTVIVGTLVKPDPPDVTKFIAVGPANPT